MLLVIVFDEYIFWIPYILCVLGTFLTGSEHNDEFFRDEHGRIRTRTNRSGGIQVVDRVHVFGFVWRNCYLLCFYIWFIILYDHL